ncbi:MAG: hypothetical protein IPI38_19665 [Gemmatimonadetes bacterium]|nr:hypothetical protein [Gemmatimonadota bacterium]
MASPAATASSASPYFQGQGWQPSYPETTGYLIPTLLEAARVLEDPALVDRALRAARWEIAIQLESGAVQGGVIGEGRTPAIFNTGQVMFGWLAAFEHTGEGSTPMPSVAPAATWYSRWTGRGSSGRGSRTSRGRTPPSTTRG